MKKGSFFQLFLLITSYSLVCCQTKKESESAEISYDTATVALSFPKDQYNFIFKNESLLEYQNFLNQLDSSNVKSAIIAVAKFESLFTEADMSTCDSAYYLFEKFYSKMNQGLNEVHSKNESRFDSLIFHKEESKNSRFLNEYTASLENNGFMVSSSEGITYVKENRNFIKENFYRKLSSALIEYLDQLNTENEKVFWDDGGLIIEPTELVDRLVWWEKFNNNGSHPFRSNAVIWEKMYFNSIVLGEDNTPIRNYDNPELNEYFEKAYNYLFNKYPNSKYSSSLKNYYTALIKSDTVFINKYQSQVKELTK
jgi:hypothetical protein